MDRFEQHAIQAAKRTPVIEKAGIRKLVNGPIPISADGEVRRRAVDVHPM